MKPFNFRSKPAITIYILFLLGFYSSCIEPFTLTVKKWNVESQKWQGQKELKIALLTDIHMIWPWMTPAHLERIVQRTNELNPDIVLLLGDYIGTHLFGLQVDPTEGLAPLLKLSAPCGTYAVLGNHDLHNIKPWSPHPKDWPQALVKTGIPVLQNQSHLLNCGGRQFWIAGLKDRWWQKADVRKTLENVKDDNPVIMMMHNPDSFPEVPQSVALSVAGHTHGGQIKFPFYGVVEAVLPSKYGPRYLYGHVIEDGKDLMISSGLGMTGIPIRFRVPPEITLVTLKSKN